MNARDVGLLLTTWGLGNLIGSLILGYWADWSGRKLCLIVSMLLTIIFSVATCFTYSFYPFLVLWFLTAISFGGILPVAIIYLSECLPDDWRGSFNMMMEIFRSVGLFICTAIAFIANGSWRFLIWSPILLVCTALYFMIFHMHESSRYLMSINNTKGVVEYLNAMAKINNWDIKVTYLYPDVDLDKENYQNKPSKGLCKRLFGWKMCRTSISLIIVWSA